ncbi:MAG: hypothetical protein ACRD68_14070 [Pyrinomonadaceae bacterium]
MFDWQTAVAVLIILAAGLYVARRGWARIRSFRAAGRNSGETKSCASGCGGCGEGQEVTPAPAKVLVQIGRAGSGAGARGRRR